ncbi:MAG: hypothetical protein LC659_15045 [Myxococcales bacterium]|nr:hypothetical protein [Myxococcales bacterium]
MKRFLLVAAAAVALAACSDMFSPPELPDLHKDPYDFAVVIPPYTGDGGVDMGSVDMAAGDVHDLATTSTD